MAIVIVCIIVYLLYHLIRLILLSEYKLYLRDLSICNEWILIHSLNKCTNFIPKTASQESSYLKTIVPTISSELQRIFKLLPKSKLSQLFLDIRGDFLYEEFPSNKIKHLNLQFHDRSIDPLVYSLMPNTIKYINDVPTSYCCELLIIYPNTVVKIPDSSFKGFITTFIAILANDCSISITTIDNEKIEKKIISEEMHIIDPTCNISIHNKSNKYALFLSCDSMRASMNEYANALLSICDRLASLTSRFKYLKIIH